jgi:glycerophosphoryl diester phosphodiesterase
MTVTDRDAVKLELLAHRGYAARYPENSHSAIRAAVEAGALNIEFDIQLSRDQVPHLLHDEDFQRTGARAERVYDLDAAAIEALRVGEVARLGSAFADETVPLLSKVVEDMQNWPEVTAFVEIKRQSLAHFGAEVVLHAVLDTLQPVIHQCVIISFDPEVLLAARRLISRPVGWAIRIWNEDSRRQAMALQPEYLFCNKDKLPPASEPLWAGNWKWVVYEITDPTQARELGQRGVAMIETMAFAEMHKALEEG